MSDSPGQPEPIRARPVSAAPTVKLVTDANAPPALPVSANPLVIDRPRKKILLDMAVAGGVFFLTLVALEVIADHAFGDRAGRQPPGAWVLVGERTILAIVTVILLGVLLRRSGHAIASIGIRAERNSVTLLWGFGTYLAILAYGVGLQYAASRWWPGAAQAMREMERGHLEHLPPMIPVHMVLFSLMVAVSEELFFRGFLLTRLRSLTRSWAPAVLILSAVFAVLHIRQGLMAVTLIFGLSVLLCLSMIWRRNVLVPIVAHALFDLTSLAVLNYTVRGQ